MNPCINGRPVPDSIADVARQFVEAAARNPRGKRIIFVKRGEWLVTLGNCAIEMGATCGVPVIRDEHVPVAKIPYHSVDHWINRLDKQGYGAVLVGQEYATVRELQNEFERCANHVVARYQSGGFEDATVQDQAVLDNLHRAYNALSAASD